MLHVLLLDDGLHRHVAEERDLRAMLLLHRLLGPADQDVGDDADLAQLSYRMLGGLGLHLTRGVEVGQQGQVDEHDVVATLLEPELPDRLEEGLALDIPHRSAELADDDIDILVIHVLDASLDLVGDMGDHLDSRTEIVSTPLLGDHLVVDLASRIVRIPGQLGVGETFIVAKVEIRLGSILCDVDLAVLVRTHGPGVDVDVRIQFLKGDLEAMALQQQPDRACGESLAKRGNHPSRNEDILGH